jgi:hypothetical protein
MERICCECKNKKLENYTMKIDRDNLHKVIKFEGAFYHYDCFVDVCKRKSKRTNASPKWGLALETLDDIKKDTAKLLGEELTKYEIFQFMLEHYDIKVVPSKIFQKLEDIYHGRWKGLGCCIPPEDILDMWNRKMDFLIKTRMNNITLGKEMDAAQQINYDISVLINKYDSYLKWKERNKIIEQETNKVHTEILKTVDLDKLSKITQNHQKEEEDDMDALLDELFD